MSVCLCVEIMFQVSKNRWQLHTSWPSYLGFFPPEVSPGSSTPIVRSLFCCTVLASPFLDKKALHLALKCTFQYTLPVLAAMVSEPLVNHQ